MFGFTQTEVAELDVDVQQLNTYLVQMRSSITSIQAGKATLSTTDLAAVSALVAARDQFLSQLKAHLLTNVRPQTSTILSNYATQVDAKASSAFGVPLI